MKDIDKIPIIDLYLLKEYLNNSKNNNKINKIPTIKLEETGGKNERINRTRKN